MKLLGCQMEDMSWLTPLQVTCRPRKPRQRPRASLILLFTFVPTCLATSLMVSTQPILQPLCREASFLR